jgi:hypothetical protein
MDSEQSENPIPRDWDEIWSGEIDDKYVDIPGFRIYDGVVYVEKEDGWLALDDHIEQIVEEKIGNYEQ